MRNVYKFELLNTYIVDSRVLTELGIPNKEVKYSFRYTYRDRNNTLVVPISKKIKATVDTDFPHRGKIDIRSLVNIVTDFTFDDKIYLHSDCTIPRAKVTQKYTRVLKADKADICVVPKLERIYDTENLAIFLNKEKNKIYVLEPSSEWVQRELIIYTAEKCAGFALGSSVLDINPSLQGTLIEEKQYYSVYPNDTFSMSNWKDFLASSLIYYGPTLSLYNKESWIADMLYNKLHDIITEDRLLLTLGDSTNEFTKEAYDNLREMLNSSDSTVVGLGLKAIAEMDYEKYKNTTIHLLANNTYWCRNDMRSNASVKYMLKYLNLWNGRPKEYYTSIITQEDFTLMQEVVKSDFQERVEAIQKLFNNRFPFAKLNLTYQFEVSPKLEKESSTSETNKDDFEDDLDYDDD